MHAIRVFVAHFVSYWLVGLMCDVGVDFPRIAKNVLRTQFFAILPALVAYQYLIPKEGLLYPIPDGLWPLKIYLFHKIQDYAFYAIHRFLLHSRPGYAWVHKYHHEMTNPIAIGALYGHWLEMIVSMVPVVLGPLFFGASNWTWELWTILTTFEALVVHDANISDFHPGHHKDPKQNFALGLWDGLAH